MNVKSLINSPTIARCFKLLPLLCILLVFSWIRLEDRGVERLDPDEALYSWYALNLSQTPSFLFSKEIIQFHPPLFSLLLAGTDAVIPSSFSHRFLIYVLCLVGIAGIYHLGKKAGGSYLGIFSALTLSLNYLFLSQSMNITIDCPFLVCHIFLVLLLLKTAESEKVSGSDIAAGICGAAAILLKWSGILVIPLLCVYYFFIIPQKSLRNKLRKAAIPLLLTLFTAGLLYLNNIAQWGYIGSSSVVKGRYLIKPFWYYLINMQNILIIPYLLPCLLYGLFAVVRRGDYKAKLLLAWFIIFGIAISTVGEKNLRYSLLVLPSSLLLAGIGLESFINTYLKKYSAAAKWICILVVAGTFFGINHRTQAFLNLNARKFVGFNEAGQWIKNYPFDVVVLAGSPRAIRYYSGRNFREFGGNLAALPKDKQVFEKMVNNSNTAIILETDRWEGTQPRWIYPLTGDKIKYLNSLGFHLVKVIDKEIISGRGIAHWAPVVWIFVKRPVAHPPADYAVHLQPYQNGIIDSLEEVRRLPARSYYGRSYSGEKKVALTFDDGPTAEYTNQILDVLKKYQIKATFFLVGKRMKQYPDVVRRIYIEGHAVGLHSYAHVNMLNFSNDQWLEEIKKSQELFEEILGISPDFFRPPFGIINSKQVALLASQGIRVVAWSTNSYDLYPGEKSAKSIVAQVTRNAFPGTVVLIHERAAESRNEKDYGALVQALPEIVEYLQRQEYRFFKIPELLSESNLPEKN